MTEKKRGGRASHEKEKAEMLFAFYRFMGEGRTLSKLHEAVCQMGVKASLKTLERYSSKYDWQKRLLELNAKDKERQEKALGQQIDQMNARHAQFAQGMMGLALAGINWQQSQMVTQNGRNQLALTVREIVELFRAAQSGERLARGQATSRIEVWVDVAQTVVKEFGLIFLSVNSYPNEAQRKAEFIRLADEMISRYFTENARQIIDSPKESGYNVH